MIILYSNNCPRCNILKSKLASKSINYTEVNDTDYMLSIGLNDMPILEVDSVKMEFSDANDWINAQ